MIIYLVLDNQFDQPKWTDKCKAFLEQTDAMRYLHELMTSDEVRKYALPTMPDTTKSPWEQGLFIIKEVWLES